MTFKFPFLKSLKTGETNGTFNSFSLIAFAYSTLAKLIRSSPSFNSALRCAVNLSFQNPYKSLFFFTPNFVPIRSEEHTSELQSRPHLVCRLLLEKKIARRQVR